MLGDPKSSDSNLGGPHFLPDSLAPSDTASRVGVHLLGNGQSYLPTSPDKWTESTGMLKMYTWSLTNTDANVSLGEGLYLQPNYNFPSKESVSFNFMAAVTICSGFGAPKRKPETGSTVSPSICHEGPEQEHMAERLKLKAVAEESCSVHIWGL